MSGQQQLSPEDLNKIIVEGLEQAREREARRREEERQRRWREEMDTAVTARSLFPNLRSATRKDYQRWLAGYMSQGGRPTHYYDYPFERVRDSFFVAVADFTLIPLYGVNAVHVIVPEEFNYYLRDGDLGHSTLYFYFEDRFRVVGSYWVPAYNDLKF